MKTAKIFWQVYSLFLESRKMWYMTENTNILKTADKSSRSGFLDSLRGINLTSMILYHLLWDLVYLYGINIPWYDSQIGYLWQQAICWLFIFLSGFCFLLGKRALKRGILVSLGGMVITLVTILLMPKERVVFGILTFLGAAMIGSAMLKKLLMKIPSIIGLMGSIFLFLVFRDCNQGFLGFEGIHLLKIPEVLYQGHIMSFLGFPDSLFRSTDYFSFLPWYFLYLSGLYFYRYFILEKEVPLKREPSIPLFSFMGKYSLQIYLLHQPFLYLILTIIFR